MVGGGVSGLKMAREGGRGGGRGGGGGDGKSGRLVSLISRPKTATYLSSIFLSLSPLR